MLPLHAVGGGDGPGVAEQGGAALVQERGCNERGYEAGLEAGHRTCPPLPERDLPRPLAVLRLVAVHDLAAAELLPEGGGHHLAAADAPAAPAGGRVNESIVPPNWDLYLGLACWARKVLLSQGVFPQIS